MALTGLLRPEIIEIWHKCLKSVLEANFLTNQFWYQFQMKYAFLWCWAVNIIVVLAKFSLLNFCFYYFFFWSGFCMKLPLLSTSVITTRNLILKRHWPMKRSSALPSFSHLCGSYKACIFVMQLICRLSSTFYDPLSWRVFDVVCSLCKSQCCLAATLRACRLGICFYYLWKVLTPFFEVCHMMRINWTKTQLYWWYIWGIVM